MLQTPGVPPQDLLTLDDNVEIVPKTAPDQDVFVASTRANDMAAFANNGYDNDHRPDYDFQCLLAAASLATGDGGGDDVVVYVMDFNQGTGGDLLNTFHINEAFNKADNTTIDGWYRTILFQKSA